MMYQRTHRILLVLLALLPTVQALADQQVTVAALTNGTVSVDKPTASTGETVTLTISPAEGFRLKNGSLLVEQVTQSSNGDSGNLRRSAVGGIGLFVGVNRTSVATYSFVMPATDVEVRAFFKEKEAEGTTVMIEASESSDTTVPVTGVTVSVTNDEQTGGIVIDEVVVPDDKYGTNIAVQIPATVTDAEGNEVPVTGIAGNALYGQTDVTDVYLPETDEPLDIAENALCIDNHDGEDHQVVTVHTPLSMLDDYALMASLGENYETGKIQATARAIHRYWTFSCGVDVKLPIGVTFYACRQLDEGNIEIVRIDEDVIKANNGVLIACADDEGNAYEMVASPNENLPSGSVPSTHNASSYEGNLLEPVIQSAHFSAGDYFVMANNAFYAIAEENSDARIPACKAVLHLQENVQYSKKMNVVKRSR